MSHQEHARLRAVRGEQLVKELKVHLYLRRQGHRKGIGELVVAADERGQAQVCVPVGKDGDGMTTGKSWSRGRLRQKGHGLPKQGEIACR